MQHRVRKKLDPDVIKTAPDETPASEADLSKAEEEKLSSLVSALQVENSELASENERLSKERDVESIKARLIEPYARNVFRFLVGYSSSVGIFIVLHGFKAWGFALDPIVLSVLSGSTALSAIGLVGIVVRGLFLSNGAPSVPLKSKGNRPAH